ncbi:MAG: site-2 protease family protein [candidate division WOR-3 bacterium]
MSDIPYSQDRPDQALPIDIAALARHMEIEAIQDNRLYGRIREPLAENLARLKELFKAQGYIAYFARWQNGHMVTYGPAIPRQPVRIWVNILLLGLTILTTLLVGSLNRGGNPFRNPLELHLGLPFSLGIILVLGSHELAHYLVARRHGVDATPPYFLPVPHPMTGTMGAFIKIRSPVPSRSALVRVGIAGPLTGFLVAIPVSAVGLALSRVIELGTAPGMRLGSPLLFELLSRLFHGNPGPGRDVLLHPLAFAGWLGFFVTALNLLPVGQLDGGHIAYAVLGRRYRLFRWFVLGALLLLGIFWLGWPFWALLVTMLGLRHPPPLDDITPLSRTDWFLVALALAILILVFMPIPFPDVRF